MKIRLLIILVMAIGFSASAQTDTIRIEKVVQTIYRCSNESARFWYLNEREGVFTLVNLTISEKEIGNWFKRYSNSQNLFRSKIVHQLSRSFFHFEKLNAPGEKIHFEILKQRNNQIDLISLETNELFEFKKMEF